MKEIDLRDNKIKTFPYLLLKPDLESVLPGENELTTIDADKWEDSVVTWEKVNFPKNQLMHVRFSEGMMRKGPAAG